MHVKKSNVKSQVVTSLPDVKHEYDSRVKRYTVIMCLRFVSIGLIFVIPLPWSLIPMVFAVFSPWFAVLIANNKKHETVEVERPVLTLE